MHSAPRHRRTAPAPGAVVNLSDRERLVNGVPPARDCKSRA